MSRHLTLIVTCVMLPLLCIAQTKEPVDYVNPNIGGIGQLLQPTYPTVQLPYSMMRVVPFTTPGVTDRYLADRIYGFPVGGAMMMPVTGVASTDPAKNASLYDHDLETATPYYYAVTLEKNDIQVEYTVSQRAVYYRLTFPSGAPARIVFSAPGNAQLSSPNDRAIAGQGAATQVPGGRPGNARYFYAEFSQPVTVHPLDGMMVPRERGSSTEPGTGMVTEFKIAIGAAVGVRVGISYISVDQAKRNLEREIPKWNFETTRADARRTWSQALGKIAIKGGTEDSASSSTPPSTGQ
jgi:putative alpha-1,2-mannosidase